MRTILALVLMAMPAHALDLSREAPSTNIEVQPQQYLRECVQGAYGLIPVMYCRYEPIIGMGGGIVPYFCAYKNADPMGVVCYPDPEYGH